MVWSKPALLALASCLLGGPAAVAQEEAAKTPLPSPSVLADGGEAAQCAYVKPLSPKLAETATRFRKVITGPPENLTAFMSSPEGMELFRALAAQDGPRTANDWANLCRYKADNAAVTVAPRTVFIGDSITELWAAFDPDLFAGRTLGRGISGQTSSQILLRFNADVVALRPAVVHVMAGTNDVAANTGPISDADILRNLSAMIDIAKANRIKVVVASVPPMAKVAWRPNLPGLPARVERINAALKDLAAAKGVVFVNYHAAMKNDQGGLSATLSQDGVHPSGAGYARMRPLTERALKMAALGRKAVVE